MDQPAAPPQVRKIAGLSSKTVMTVEWDQVPDSALPGGEIRGYKLWITDPNTSASWLAFDGPSLHLSEQTQFSLYNLTTGVDYEFIV
jgi:hypothetical protein